MYLILMHISVSIWIILNFNVVQNHLQNNVVLSYSGTASIILEIDQLSPTEVEICALQIIVFQNVCQTNIQNHCCFLGQYDDLTYLDYKIRPMRIKDNNFYCHVFPFLTTEIDMFPDEFLGFSVFMVERWLLIHLRRSPVSPMYSLEQTLQLIRQMLLICLCDKTCCTIFCR